jgi:3-phosphoglycerate kinase
MKLRTVRDIKNLRGTRVLVRIDANVPIKDGVVEDPSRLWAVLPTIQYLSGRGAIVILIAHLGRPEGHVQNEYSLAPVARRLSQISGHVVSFIPDLGGEVTRSALSAAVPGQVFMLENLRFDRGEESNGGSFAKRLASLATVFVNDGFGVSHRAHASVVAVTRYLPSYAGLLMERELLVLTHVRTAPQSPSVALLGGAKISTKIGLIKTFSKRYDTVLVGGGLVNALMTARGFKIGDSFVERGTANVAHELLKLRNLIMPSDVLIGNPKHPGSRVRVVPVETDAPFTVCRAPEAIVDIGPRTILRYATFIKGARTIVWNGPMGIFEVPKFSHGTMALARSIAARSKGRALGVVGGGETIEAVMRSGMARYLDHISTGGGAMLEFLEGRSLPGVKPLYAKNVTPKKTKRKKS